MTTLKNPTEILNETESYRRRKILINALNNTSDTDISIALVSMSTEFLETLMQNCELIINLRQSAVGE